MPRWFEKLPTDAPCFCVVGSPVGHSRSPEIHSAFGEQTRIALHYERVEVPAGAFAAALAEFIAAGGRGLNVTVPLKEEACAAAGEHLAAAAATGAANTIVVQPDGRVLADNTDGRGLVRDLAINHGVVLAGRRILLLGAGGAARGVIPNLLEAAPAELAIANRTEARARELAARFRHLGPLTASSLEEPGAGPFDVIVNATSLSLSDAVPPIPRSSVGPETWCYDMMYTATGRTAFLDWCSVAGAAAVSDGFGMLVEQAACAFELWHGVAPATAPVIAALRSPNRV
ncbi:MAG: shikimate dehydrogenase [Gammaproteobacteria bacterium]|jgi:shikimate dehydrogenase